MSNLTAAKKPLPNRLGIDPKTQATKSKSTRHTYSFPAFIEQTPRVKALLDYWEFVDLMGYQGGKENFSELHHEMVDFMTQIQSVPTPEDKMCFRRHMQVPRGHLKTTLTVAYVLWRIYRNPDIRILVATATKDLSLQIVKQAKQLLENETLQEEVWNIRPHIDGALIPTMDRGQTYRRRRQAIEDLIEDNADTQAADKKIVWRADAVQVIRRKMCKEPTLQATSVGSNITGMHFDLIILDDIINDDTTATAEKMEKTLEWARDVESILDPPQSVLCGHLGTFEMREIVGDEQIVVGTRYAKGDFYEYLEQNQEELEYSIFKRNIYKNGKDDSDGFIFPEKFTPIYVDRLKKRLGTRRFGSQYLNAIITAEEQILHSENITWYASNSVEVIDRKVRISVPGGEVIDIFPFLVVDPAISQKKTADNSVVMVGGIDYNRNLYIIDMFVGKVTPDNLVKEIFRLADKWQVRAAHVEVVSFQQALIYMIRQKFQEYRPIALIEYRPKGDKKARIETHLEPLFTNHKVYMPQWMSANTQLMEEIYYFPAPSAHDDTLDAMAMICECASPTPDRKKRRSNAVNTNASNSKYGGLR